jgi:hypothetical protein
LRPPSTQDDEIDVWQHAWVRFPPSSFLSSVSWLLFCPLGGSLRQDASTGMVFGPGGRLDGAGRGRKGGGTRIFPDSLLLFHVVLHLVAASCACGARGSGPLAVCRGGRARRSGHEWEHGPPLGRSPGGSALSAVARPSCSPLDKGADADTLGVEWQRARRPWMRASTAAWCWGAAIGARDVHGNTAATSTRAASVAPPPSSQRCSRQRRDHRRDMCHGRRHAADAGLQQGPRGSRLPPPRLQQRAQHARWAR